MTLYWETPCKHGRVERHGDIWPDNLDKFSNGICPGGSREEVTIDYKAGAKRIWFMSPCEQSWDYVMQTATLAINAALDTATYPSSTYSTTEQETVPPV
jgi:hypothetical protein